MLIAEKEKEIRQLDSLWKILEIFPPPWKRSFEEFVNISSSHLSRVLVFKLFHKLIG